MNKALLSGGPLNKQTLHSQILPDEIYIAAKAGENAMFGDYPANFSHRYKSVSPIFTVGDNLSVRHYVYTDTGLKPSNSPSPQ